jgi:phage terminase small subunit
MLLLENAKQERFAQALAAGKNAVDAYEFAGYRRNRGHASTLRKDPKLLKRVDEILESRGQIQARGALAAIERACLTKSTVIDMLIADRELARKNGQSSAAIRATELIGIELGMFVKRTDNKHTVERRFSELSEEEQERVAGELLREAREVIEEQKRLAAERASEAEWVEVCEGGAPTLDHRHELRHRDRVD